MGEARILLRDAADLTATVPAEVERKLTVPELLWNDGFVRKSLIIIFLAAAWEIYGTFLDNPLLFPTFHDTILTMWDKVRDGTIPLRAWASLKVLFMGYAAGIVLAAVFTILAISTRIGTDLLETITAMFNPLPAIALLPLALICFGLGTLIAAVAMLPGAGRLTLDRDGFEAKSMFRGFRARWQNVGGFATASLPPLGHTLVVYDDVSLAQGMVAAANVKLTGRNAALADTYGLKADQLASLMESWRERAVSR